MAVPSLVGRQPAFLQKGQATFVYPVITTA